MVNKIVVFFLSLCFWAFIGFVTFHGMGYSIDDLALFSQYREVDKDDDGESVKAKGEYVEEEGKNSLENTVLSEEDDVFDKVFYPYYEMLDKREQEVYKEIYAHAKERTTTFVPKQELHVDVITKIVECVYKDHPELFWLDTSFEYRYTDDFLCVQIILNFNETIDYFDEAKYKFETISNEIISYAKDLESDYEKEKYVHNKLIDMLEYEVDSDLNQSAYSALVNGVTVCAGYARAFQHIMIALGVPTYYVTGDANGEHAWNIIKLPDGYYNVDVTWNDNESNIYEYFNLDDDEFDSTHSRDELSLQLPECNGKDYRKEYLSIYGF